jgi:hypothetical protein
VAASHYENAYIAPVRLIDGAGNPAEYGAAVYAVTFAAVAVAAAQDLFELVAPADKTLAVRRITIGQYTDFGDSAAEILSVRAIRGYTTGGSGGSAATPAPLSGSGTSGAAAEVNNTTVAKDGTAVTLLADVFNIAAGFLWAPAPAEFILVPPSARLVVTVTAPADSLTMNGTLIFEERD